MMTLFSIVLSNLLVAALLAIPAWLVSRWGRRPALAHALWVLVLVKLVTPPLLRLPLPLLNVSPSGEPVEAAPCTVPQPEPPPLPAGPDELVLILDRLVLLESLADPQQPLPAPAETTASAMLAPWGPTLLLGVWTLGSVGYLALAGWRAWLFSRRLRQAEAPAGDLLGRVEALAARLGVKAPPLRVVYGRLSPLVWGFFRPCLVLPHGLEEAVGPAGWRTLVAHELAHLRRRDSLVRGLELLVGTLYWWCPLAWLACRELREAEEQCCDAWVVSSLPDQKKTYATALIDVLDFLSPAAVSAPLGCGLSPVADLKRRLTMILSGSPSPRLGRSAGLGLAVLAAVVLPLVPALSAAQAPAESPVADKLFVVGKPGEGQGGIKLELKLADEQAELAKTQQKLAEIEAQRVMIEAQKAILEQGKLVELRQKLAELEAQRARLTAQMAELAAQAKKLELAAQAKKLTEVKPQDKPSQQPKLGVAVDPSQTPERRIICIELPGKTSPEEIEKLVKQVRDLVGKDKKVTVQSVAEGRVQMQMQWLEPKPGRLVVPAPAKPNPADSKRMEQLEQRLDKMFEQLEQLRKELKSGKK